MAKHLAKLRGQPDIGIKYTGLRPGEKLTEQLYTGPWPVAKTSHPRIWQVANPFDLYNLKSNWVHLQEALDVCNLAESLRWLRVLVPEYNPEPTPTLEPCHD